MIIKLNFQEHKKDYILIGLGILIFLTPFVIGRSFVWANIVSGATLIGVGAWSLIRKKKQGSVTDK